MPKNQKSDKQKERDKKGQERMKRFEESQAVEKPIVKPKDDNEYEDFIFTAWQKVEPGPWEKVEIPFRRKKKGH